LQVATAAEKVDELIVPSMMSGIQDPKPCLQILATSPTAQSRQFPMNIFIVHSSVCKSEFSSDEV